MHVVENYSDMFSRSATIHNTVWQTDGRTELLCSN